MTHAEKQKLETSSNPEAIERGMLIAEQISYAQTELEHGWRHGMYDFGDEEQTKVLDSILDKYPDLNSYRHAFEQILVSFSSAQITVEEVWNALVQPEDISPKGETFPSNIYAGTSEQNSKYVMQSLLNFEPQHSAHAYKTPIALLFVVDRSDLVALCAQIQEVDETSSQDTDGLFFMAINKKLPIIVCPIDEEDNLVTGFIHEQRHAIDTMLERAQQDIILEGLYLNKNRRLARRLIKNKKSESEQEKTVRHELSAYFTLHQLVDSIAEDDPDGKPVDGKWLGDTFNEVIEESTVEGGEYHISSDPILRKSKQAVRSFMEIRDFYMQTNEAFVADQIVVNLFNQFPLKTWPAMARMLKSAHHGDAPTRLELTY